MATRLSTAHPGLGGGAYAIDFRPRALRRGRVAHRTAPLPLAVLALSALGLRRCLDTVPVLVIVITTASLLLGSLPHLLPLPGAILVRALTPVIPSFAPGYAPARQGAALGAPAVPAPTVEPVAPLVSTVSNAGAIGTAVTNLTTSATSSVRAPWQPSFLATFPYPAHIEAWRPLVRELLAEAWQEGRLDGPAARLDDDLALALIRQESQGDPDAESWVGAIGLMQVMPFTFADVMTGDRSLTCQIDSAAMWDVRSNVRAGLRYLALAMNTHDNLYWALASYNAGIDSVSDWRAAGLYAVPPAGGYWETADYAQRILRDYLSRRPDQTPLIHVPDPMPQAHVPGALRLLQDLDTQRGGPRPKEWIPNCGR